MKVRCNKAETCEQECGAKNPHDNDSCEECPFDKTAHCIRYISHGSLEELIALNSEIYP